MSGMTLDEAIKHCEEVAVECDKHEVEIEYKCGQEHRQLAEWLRELKERRENKYIAPCGNCCKDCPYSLERVIENENN